MNTNACTQPNCSGSLAADGRCVLCAKSPTETSPQTLGSQRSAAVSAEGPATSSVATSATSASSRARPLSGTTRSRTGDGMAQLAPVPTRDPGEAVLADPKVPEDKRNCSSCGKAVGRRGPDGQAGRTQGFCPHCRAQFSFVPSLQSGDMVVDRYEILGAIAHGGLGWIYLARDKNIGDDVTERWVVLKGLIDTNDPDAIEAAIAERRFLASLDHPKIVQIHDFVRHPDPRTNEPLNYIVMEYVPGKSLRDLRRQHVDEDGNPAALPLSTVLTYAADILPALGYLHQQGLLFCDFKPDNVIHVESWLKLIDLGAVRRIDDVDSAVFGTHGYAVPDDEIVEIGPSVTSDLYTVARSMAVLAIDFRRFATEYRTHLPPAEHEPLFARYNSFHRLLLRATDHDPARRFQSAEEMREQLLGVRQEVLSIETGQPHGASPTLFTPDQGAFGAPVVDDVATLTEDDVRSVRTFRALDGSDVASALAFPLVDHADPAAGFLAAMSASDPLEVLYELAHNAPVHSREVLLRKLRANLSYNNLKAASINLEELSGHADWRVTWWQGVVALRQGRAGEARGAFDSVYSDLPGEIAPKLALAASAELCGDTAAALGIYSRIWQTDRRHVSAAYGQARLLANDGHHDNAVSVLDAVPADSSQHTAAQFAAVGLILTAPGGVGPAAVRDAAARTQRLKLAPRQKHLLTARVLWAGLACVSYPGAADASRPETILGREWTETALKFGLEAAYRSLAATSLERLERIHFIDRANKIRPWTLT